jgi:transposase InsO family protein
LAVSRSGYYAWRGRPASKREQENTALAREIREVHQSRRGVYGSPRVHIELRARGHRISRKRVAYLMRAEGLEGKRPRLFRRTTDSAHAFPTAPNLLKRNFATHQPNQAWVADVTFIWTGEGWSYLAVVLDLFSRRVIGWAMSDSNDAQLVTAALRRAVARRGECRGLIHHSDRGTTYASDLYQRELRACGMRPSMSRKGDCWDNAVAESFFATLRAELTDGERYRTRHDALVSIQTYIDDFYNLVRRHSTVQYLSPVEYELRMWNAA